MSTPSKLSQLRELSVVVADTGDYEAIKRLQPVDCTTNPTLVKKALDLPVYAELIERELAWGRQQTGDREAVVHAVADRLTIGVGALLSTLVPGRVSTEVDADLAHDTAATVAKARQFIQMYADAGVPREDPDQDRRDLGRRGSRAHPAGRGHRLQPDPDLQPDPGAGLQRSRGVPDLAIRRPHPGLVRGQRPGPGHHR